MITKTVQITVVSIEELADKVAEKLIDKIEVYLNQLNKKESDVLLSRQEAAEYLKVSLTTIHHWSNQKIIKPIYLGNRVYFKKQDILNHIEGH
jgi:excisionase family DNA binding protein